MNVEAMDGPSSSKKRKMNPAKKNATKIPLDMVSCYNSDRIHFDDIKLSGVEPPMTQFMESDRVFTSIILEDVTFKKDHILFWKKSGKNFTEVIIKNCSISSSDFIVILRNMTNLTKLTILKSPVVCANLQFDIEKETHDLLMISSKLTSFTIDTSWSDLESTNFAKWLTKMPKITEFEIALIDEDSFIIDCLKFWGNQLKTLRLKNKISKEIREKIYELEITGLQVFQIGSETEDEYDGNDYEDGKTLLEFISKQGNLLEFCVGICEVNEQFLSKIPKNAPKLKTLGVFNTNGFEDPITNKSNVLAFLGTLSKIHFSTMSFSPLSNFLERPNNNLTHLTYEITSEDFDSRDCRRNWDIPFDVMNGFDNLTYFDVTDQYICGCDIQDILKHLTQLQVLKVKSKHTISDFAFTGKGDQYPKAIKYWKYTKKGYRKKHFFTLQRMKNLVELDIQSTDNKITDLALNQIAKLKNLKIVNLTNYKKITIFGVSKVVASCKNLEQITLTGCKKKIANEIASHFKKRPAKVIYKMEPEKSK